jgi:hypothetical protein
LLQEDRGERRKLVLGQPIAESNRYILTSSQ